MSEVSAFIVAIAMICCFASIIWWLIAAVAKKNIRIPFRVGITCVAVVVVFTIIGTISWTKTDDYQEYLAEKAAEDTKKEEQEREEEENRLKEQEEQRNTEKQENVAEMETENGSEFIAETERQEEVSEVQSDVENTETSYEEDVIESENTETENTEITESEESEEEYKASCQKYTYKDVLRNPEDYVGQRVKITAKISSVHEKSLLNPTKYYFAYTNDEYDMWFGDEYGIFDCRDDGDFKILEDDVIAIYGEISEPQETASLITNSQEVFCIDMKYAELISE